MTASTLLAGWLGLTPALAHAATFSATLDGLQNVPPIPAVTATGTATFILNDAQTELTYHIEYSGLIGDETDAHIHNATPRENGGIVFTLPVGSPKDGVWAIPANMVTELFAGRLYVNVHTDVYITGEIRGNIMATVPVEPTSLGAVKARYQGP
jgi:hypothetical protein